MLVNTQYFREAALYYEKHGQYPYGIKGSDEYKRWWAEERDRCLYGYSTGGMWIPGYYYYYLNYNPIQLVERIGTGKSGIRKLGFPKFWDMDYMFHMSAHIARHGITKEELEKLPMSIPIKTDEENLAGGHHLLYLKPRGIGASFKNGSMANRNFHLVPNSKTFLLAHDKEFLVKDGIYSKFQEYRSWVNAHAPEFAVSSDFKAGQTDMHFRASYDDGDRNELGPMSEVIGITVNNKPDKARGKRGMLYLWEEAGRFGQLDVVWNIARNSVEEGGVIYGLMIAFGTGGTEGSDFRSMEVMFDNPRAYNCLAFNNIWDIGLEGMDCSLFSPAYYNIQHIDSQGNSDAVSGKVHVDKLVSDAEKSPDTSLVLRVKAENPSTPREAMLNTETNKFAKEGLVEWRNKLFANTYYKEFGTPVTLVQDVESGKIKTELSTIKPIVGYPHSRRDDLRGCIVEYTTPWMDQDGNIPDNLYIIGHDPYADDDAQDVTSLGAAYVMMNTNNLVPNDHGNRIVASYIGRPRTTDEYNYNLFLLAKRWNAKIGFENDRGDVVGYAKRFNMLHLLAEEFELGFDEQIKVKNRSTYRYGMRMGSGRLNTKILTGNNYIHDWLFESRGETEDKTFKYNFHYIYDVGLLDELRFYNGEGNYDRISALRICMYYMRELAYSDQVARVKKSKHNSFSKFMHTPRFQ